MRLGGALAALALARAAAGAAHADATRTASHAHALPPPPRARAPAKQPPPPALFQNLLPEGSLCANKTDALFYARGRDPLCPCDCLGCRCRHAHRAHVHAALPRRPCATLAAIYVLTCCAALAAGCARSAYVACWECEPPPCRQQAFYECERGYGSYFNEDTQACEWMRLRVPPFDCPLVRPRRRARACARVLASLSSCAQKCIAVFR
jgi:hypothetical protein